MRVIISNLFDDSRKKRHVWPFSWLWSGCDNGLSPLQGCAHPTASGRLSCRLPASPAEGASRSAISLQTGNYKQRKRETDLCHFHQGHVSLYYCMFVCMSVYIHMCKSVFSVCLFVTWLSAHSVQLKNMAYLQMVHRLSLILLWVLNFWINSKS